MLVIGLCGGSKAARLDVADQIFYAGCGRFSMFNSGVNSTESGRLAMLREMLRGADLPWCDRGFVYVDVSTASEAALIRQAGGSIWHIQGAVSGQVAINRFDLMVTPMQQGDRHFRPVLEALGELVIRKRQRSA